MWSVTRCDSGGLGVAGATTACCMISLSKHDSSIGKNMCGRFDGGAEEGGLSNYMCQRKCESVFECASMEHTICAQPV